MNTVFTSPIDQSVDEQQQGIFDPLHDDRESRVVLQTHPRGNGPIDEDDARRGHERWDTVLGW